MPEWSNGAVSKTVGRVSAPGVRIPLPLLFYVRAFAIASIRPVDKSGQQVDSFNHFGPLPYGRGSVLKDNRIQSRDRKGAGQND